MSKSLVPFDPYKAYDALSKMKGKLSFRQSKYFRPAMTAAGAGAGALYGLGAGALEMVVRGQKPTVGRHVFNGSIGAAGGALWGQAIGRAYQMPAGTAPKVDGMREFIKHYGERELHRTFHPDMLASKDLPAEDVARYTEDYKKYLGSRDKRASFNPYQDYLEKVAYKLRPEHLEALAQKYHAGASLEQVAAEHGVTKGALSRFFKINGVESRRAGGKGPAKLLPEHLETLTQKYHAGATLDQLAAEHGVTKGAISTFFSKNGVPARQPGIIAAVKPEHLEDIRRRYDAGETIETIGKDYGVGKGQMSDVFKKNGIESRRPNAGRPRTLTPEQEAEIAEKHRSGKYRLGQLAKEYGTSIGTIHRTVNVINPIKQARAGTRPEKTPYQRYMSRYAGMTPTAIQLGGGQKIDYRDFSSIPLAQEHAQNHIALRQAMSEVNELAQHPVHLGAPSIADPLNFGKTFREALHGFRL